MKKEGIRQPDSKRAARYDLKILGRLTLEKDGGKEVSCICNTVNISLSGAFVETGSMIPVGSLLKYSFRIPGVDTPINITGEIVRGVHNIPRKIINVTEEGVSVLGIESQACRGGSLNRYGIMFLDVKEEDKKALEAFFIKEQSSGVQKG